jgi:hypothetical protein
MIVRRLPTAGLEVQSATATAVVDLLGGISSLSQYTGDPTEELLAPIAPPGTVTWDPAAPVLRGTEFTVVPG